MSNFFVAVKSTLDKMMSDKLTQISADNKPLIGCDLDDVTQSGAVLQSSQDALLWQMVSMSPDPRHPLYVVTYYIGAKTTQDVGNYDLASLVSQLSDLHDTGLSIDVRDYSGEIASDVVGNLFVVDAQIAPHQFDNQSGLRVIQVTARGASYG